MSTWLLTTGFSLALDATQDSGSSSTDWTETEKAQIRNRLGIDGTSSAPSATPSLAYSTQVDALESDTTTLLARCDVAISTRLATSGYTAPDNATITTIQADTTAIKAKTDSLTFTVANEVNANTRYIKGQVINGSGTAGDPWSP